MIHLKAPDEDRPTATECPPSPVSAGPASAVRCGLASSLLIDSWRSGGPVLCAC